MDFIYSTLVILSFFHSILGQIDSYAPIFPIGTKPSYHDDLSTTDRCHQINHKVCKNMQYNETMLPTWLGVFDWNDAAKRVSDYDPLMGLKCSNYLQMLLCTVYFPMCTQATKLPTSIPPCMELCLHVKGKCEKFMKPAQIPWPKDLNCDKLPRAGELCVKPANFSLDSTSGAAESEHVQAADEMGHKNEIINYDCSSAETRVDSSLNNSSMDSKSLPLCLTHCKANVFYRHGDKEFAQHWQFIWAFICFISSLLTLIAFLNNKRRFNYPERPIAYLSMCYILNSIGYLIRGIVGYELSGCHSYLSPNESPATESRHLIKPSHETPLCTTIYLIMSYSSFSSSIWWVVLGVSWYLSTSRTWSPEGVESISSIFHMLAWSVPAVRAIVSLILHRIDANELTGICSIGNNDSRSFLYFEIIPKIICLSIGLVFLIIGFISVFRVRRNLKNPLILRMVESCDFNNRRRLEKMIAKLSVFTVLYTVPTMSLIIGHLYEYIMMNEWQKAVRELNHKNPACINPYGIKWSDPECHPKTLPIPEIGMLQIFASLVIGITSGIWIWANKKTFCDLKNFCSSSKKKKKRTNMDPFLHAANKSGEVFRHHLPLPVQHQEPLSSLSSSGPTFTNSRLQSTGSTHYQNSLATSVVQGKNSNEKNSYQIYDMSGLGQDQKKYSSCV